MNAFLRQTAWAGCLAGILLTSQKALAIPDDLVRAVAALPEKSAEEKLKKATLTWALEDAAAAEEQGFPERVAPTLQDVRDLLPRSFAPARPAPENLFPRKPAPQITGVMNPADVAKLLKEDRHFPKAPGTDNLNGLRTGNAANGLAMALCHPESPLAGDPKLVVPLLRRMQCMYDTLYPGSKQLADFGNVATMPQIYMLVNSVYPDLILPSRKTDWLEGLRRNTEATFKLREKVFTECKPGTSYVNADVKYINALAFGGMLLNEPRYTKLAEAGVRLQATALYGDGAFAYIGWQNEEPTYHGIALAELTRLWQVTGNPLAIDLVKRSFNYQRLSFDPRWGPNGERWGATECSTGPSWKQNWNGWGPDGEALVSQLSGVPVTTPENSPDNYFVHDLNIEGPRGRFGMFSFTGNGRNLHDETRGKNTYAGCLVMFPKGEPVPKNAFDRAPLSAGLASAFTEVQYKPGEPNYRDNIYSLSREETNSTTVWNDVASLATTHRLASYYKSASDWQGQQLWLYTPQRIVGLVAVEAMKDTSAMNITGAMRLVTYRVGGQPLEADGDILGAYRYGHLRLRIHHHDYAEFGTDPYQPTSPRPKFNSFTKLVLSDKPLSERIKTPATPYAKGTRHFYLAEFRPEWSAPAESVTKVDPGDGLIGFDVTEGTKTYRLIYNGTAATVVTNLNSDGRFKFIHRSGEKYRPAWVNPDNREEMTGKPEALTGPIRESIPAFGHVVLVDGD